MGPAPRARLAAELLTFLETGAVAPGLFAPDVFGDFTLPHWRIQLRGDDEVVKLRRDGHVGRIEIEAHRVDPTPTGFVLELAERWRQDGTCWYAREMLRADVNGGSIGELAVYCCGDWDEAVQAQHRQTVTLLRP